MCGINISQTKEELLELIFGSFSRATLIGNHRLWLRVMGNAQRVLSKVIPAHVLRCCTRGTRIILLYNERIRIKTRCPTCKEMNHIGSETKQASIKYSMVEVPPVLIFPMPPTPCYKSPSTLSHPRKTCAFLPLSPLQPQQV